MQKTQIKRCSWCLGDADYIGYHDHEWGVAQYQPEKLFELLCLESLQAGLSWLTILKKRSSLRQAFCDFNPALLCHFTSSNKQQLLNNKAIIRHAAKINAMVHNAKVFMTLAEKNNMTDYFWQFVDGRPQQNHWQQLAQLPSETKASSSMAKTLKKQGFQFIGSKTCYAFMQAAGMVNDHLVDCYRHAIITRQNH